jgi:hypothetical protein
MALRKGMKGATWRDFGAVYGLRMCDGTGPCRKKWRRAAHHKGRVDTIGEIHWDGWPRRASRRGLRFFLFLAALGSRRDIRELPEWHRLYAANTWATAHAKTDFRRRLLWFESQRDRERVLELVPAHLRRDHRLVYEWATWRGRGNSHVTA